MVQCRATEVEDRNVALLQLVPPDCQLCRHWFIATINVEGVLAPRPPLLCQSSARILLPLRLLLRVGVRARHVQPVKDKTQPVLRPDALSVLSGHALCVTFPLGCAKDGLTRRELISMLGIPMRRNS